MKPLRRVFSTLLVFALLLGMFLSVLPAARATTLTLAQLQAKFPQGKYWNHVGSSSNNEDSYTSSPCPDHSSTTTCNAFTSGSMKGWQCFGFAMKLAYDAYGQDPYKWSRAYTLDNIKPGDIINQDSNSGHSIFVIGVNGDTISYADCNSDYHCVIRWDRTKQKSAINVYNIYVAPYALDTGSSTGTTTTKLTINQLQTKFPQGKYWNHVGSDSNNADSYTSSPCSDHSSVSTCNAFTQGAMKGWQCFGFAMKLAYDAYGQDPYQWERAYTLDNIKPGDIINMDSNDGKTIFVTLVTENELEYAICNANGDCKIQWGNTILKSNINVYNIYVAPYALSNTCKHNQRKHTIVSKAATCTEAGWTKNVCSFCGATVGTPSTTKALGHSYNDVVTQPTCTAKGYTTHTCSRCSNSYKDTYTNALDHDYNDVVTQPTCMKQGYTTHTCSRCGYSYEDTYTDPVDHTYQNGVCSGCGKTDPNASTSSNTPKFVVSQTTGCAGDTVTVTVSAQNNPGIVAAYLDINYDKTKLTLLSVENGNVLKDSSFSTDLTVCPYRLNWDDSAEAGNNTANGTLATLCFAISDTCGEGSLPITLTYDPENVYDTNENNVTFAVENGAVTVVECIPGDVNDDGSVNGKDVTRLRRYVGGWPEISIVQAAADVTGDGAVNGKDVTRLRRYVGGWSNVTLGPQAASVSLLSMPMPLNLSTTPTFTVSQTQGQAGETVRITVSAENNPGIVAAYLNISYDTSKLTLTKIENGSVLKDSSFSPTLSVSPYCLNWDDSTNVGNNTNNGVMATLTFKIADGCTDQTIPITLTYDAGNVYDTDEKDVFFAIVNGSVKVITDSITYVTAKDPNCTESGNIEYWYKSLTGTYYSDAACTAEISQPQTVLGALGHDLELLSKEDERSDAAGKTAHYKCSRCSALFEDAEGKTPITPIRMLGDIDGNGYIESADATLLLKYLVGLISLDEAQLAAADVDGSGKLSTIDAVYILRYAAALISSFPGT